jgi:hypothetical protein
LEPKVAWNKNQKMYKSAVEDILLRTSIVINENGRTSVFIVAL